MSDPAFPVPGHDGAGPTLEPARRADMSIGGPVRPEIARVDATSRPVVDPRPARKSQVSAAAGASPA